jgi:hypothetical protein
LQYETLRDEYERDMERRLARLERHNEVWLDAMAPVLRSLNRSLSLIYADGGWPRRNPPTWEELKRAEVVQAYRYRQEDERRRAERLRSAWRERQGGGEDGEVDEDAGRDVADGNSPHYGTAERPREECRGGSGPRPDRQDGVAACGPRTTGGWPIRHGVKNSLPSDFGAEFARAGRMAAERGDRDHVLSRVRRISSHMEVQDLAGSRGRVGRRALADLDTLEPLMRELVGTSRLVLESQAESLGPLETGHVEY